MSAGDASRVIRAPGRLVVGPTDLALTYPYGGTEVGRTRLVVLKTLGQQFRVESEGLGGDPSDILEAPNHYVFSCFLRGWDDDAIRLLLSDGYTKGSVSGHSVFSAPAGNVPGSSALPRAKVVLFVPDNPIDAPAVIVYRGVPGWTDGSEIAWQRGSELGVPLTLECVRDDEGRILSVGRIVDLTL